MFALVIWDRRARRLILARNRIGKKPLYYAATADTFLFGSEIKALLTWPGPPRATDLSAIDRYRTWGYMPTLYTAFKGIRKLAAAHYLVVEACTDGFMELECARYWHHPREAVPHDNRAAVRTRRTARKSHAFAYGVGCAARRLSIRRRRFLRRRGDDGSDRRRYRQDLFEAGFRQKNTTKPAMRAW